MHLFSLVVSLFLSFPLSKSFLFYFSFLNDLHWQNIFLQGNLIPFNNTQLCKQCSFMLHILGLSFCQGKCNSKECQTFLFLSVNTSKSKEFHAEIDGFISLWNGKRFLHTLLTAYAKYVPKIHIDIPDTLLIL